MKTNEAMNATVTIPRDDLQGLIECAQCWADSTTHKPYSTSARLFIKRAKALLAQPQPDRVKVLEDAVREHRTLLANAATRKDENLANRKLWAHLERGES